MAQSYRWSVVYAATWRLATELRRRHGSDSLRLIHYYPGHSPTGIVELGPPAEGTEKRIQFVLGGGCNGELALGEPFGSVAADPVGEWESPNYVAQYLARDPRAVVDDIEASAGLPSTSKARSTTPTLLVHRVIATVLERRALARQGFRVINGWIDNSTAGGPAAFARAALGDDLESARYPDEQMKLASPLWQVSPMIDDMGPFVEADALSLGFDEEAGTAWRADRPSAAVDLMTQYDGAARKLAPVVTLVEALLDPR